MQLHWLPSPAASCHYAAALLARGQPLADAALADALTPPVEGLRAALAQERVPADLFWEHLVPLAVESNGCAELARTVLMKTIGQAEAEPRVAFFREWLIELRAAFTAALPDLEKDLAHRVEPLRLHWSYHGTGLLGGVTRWTDPHIMVDEARVVLVHAARGGGGSAHLRYNLACLEAVTGHPVDGLPEVVRLAWLLSTLNLDLPRYTENVAPKRLTTVAGLAMIPVTLAAAEELELARADAENVAHAVRAWLAPGDEAAGWTGALLDWWETYEAMRPAWPTALAALDRLLGDEPMAVAAAASISAFPPPPPHWDQPE